MIIRGVILLLYLLVHIALTRAQETEVALTTTIDEAEVDSSLLCDFMSVDETLASVKSPSAEAAGASLGIVEGDLASVPSKIGRCCSSSLLCYFKGGVCLPSWLDIFFSCSEANLCYGSCTCFKPKNSCPDSSCGGPCGSCGTCRTSCIYPEVSAPYNCGIVPGYTCCVRCPSTCTNGATCRTICNSDETDTGSCSDEKACRCCKKNVCSGTCSKTGQCRTSCDPWGETDVGPCGSSCRCCQQISSGCSGQACGINGYCSDYCDGNQPLRAKRVAPHIDYYYPCPLGCRCCQYRYGGPYPVEPMEAKVEEAS